HRNQERGAELEQLDDAAFAEDSEILRAPHHHLFADRDPLLAGSRHALAVFVDENRLHMERAVGLPRADDVVMGDVPAALLEIVAKIPLALELAARRGGAIDRRLQEPDRELKRDALGHD